ITAKVQPANTIKEEEESAEDDYELKRREKRKNVDSSVRSYISNHILYVHPTQASQASAQEQLYQLYITMKDNPQLQQDDLPLWLALKFKFKRLHKTSEHETYVIEESSFGQVNESEPDDDDLPTEKVSQKLVAEMSKTVDEAKLRKFVNEMLRQRCT
ncbi:hypothetical protein Tco_1551433, partial [Tanacetum coccineum]